MQGIQHKHNFCYMTPKTSPDWLKLAFTVTSLLDGNYRTLKELEDLTVLKRSPDLLNNVKIGQDQLQLIMKHILFYGDYGHLVE